MKYIKLNNVRGGFVTYGFKYLAQPYVSNFSPEGVPVIKYQIVDMIHDQIVYCNASESEALQWLEEAQE